MNKNWMLCIDLMTQLRNDRYPKLGKGYNGQLMMVDDGEARFIERVDSTNGKRNMRVFEGRYINISLKDDGSYQPNFKHVRIDASMLESYVQGVTQELKEAFTSLLEK